MTLHTPIAVEPGGSDASIPTSAQEFRNAWAAVVGGLMTVTGKEGVVGITVPSGAANAGGLAVTQRGAGANFSVDVAAGYGFVIGDDITNQGLYQCWNDGTVNVAVPSPPGSGSRVHRLILQIQDHLSNGVWTSGNYTADLVLLADTGSGTPAVGNSAITLALITVNAGDASVVNAAIADYRRALGPISVIKTSDTVRTGTTLSNDPDLQLWGLQGSSWYQFMGHLRLAGDVSRQFIGQWVLPSSSVHAYFVRIGANASGGGNALTEPGFSDTDGFSCDVGTGSSITEQTLVGSFSTGGTTPNNNVILKWAANSSGSGTGATLKAGSSLYAWPVL